MGHRHCTLIAAGVAIALGALLTVATPVAAQQWPVCSRERLGITACFGTRQCACVYDRGGLMTGIPPGYRWDCGILRPGCSGEAPAEATLNPYRGPYPLAVAIDRSDRSVSVDQATSSITSNANLNVEGGVAVGPPAGGAAPPTPPRVGAPVPLQPVD